MAKERLKSPRARLFVALDLPAQVRAAVVEWGNDALSDPALRRVNAGSLHITLAFLGYLPEKEIERLAAIVTAVKASAPRIELRDPVPRPVRGQPRLFALPAESPGAVEIQAALGEELMAARLYEPEKRPFWPHVTVARVRPEGRGSRQPMRVVKPPRSLPKDLREHTFDDVRLTLYRSELQPRGARYTQLAQIELPKGQ
jgi:RNA 2',3'-cyclic 3'-phosphodiesterase